MICISCNERTIDIPTKQQCRRCYQREYRLNPINYEKKKLANRIAMSNRYKNDDLFREDTKIYQRIWCKDKYDNDPIYREKRIAIVKANSFKYKERSFKLDTTALYNKILEIQKAGLSMDHIVPINGVNVCGLHVSWNLQGLPLRENIQKGNQF